MYVSYVDICAILSDDRINNRAVKTPINQIVLIEYTIIILGDTYSDACIILTTATSDIKK